MKLNLSVTGLTKKQKDELLSYLANKEYDYFVVDKELFIVGDIKELTSVLGMLHTLKAS